MAKVWSKALSGEMAQLRNFPTDDIIKKYYTSVNMGNKDKTYFSLALKQALPKPGVFEFNDRQIQILSTASQMVLAVIAAAGVATVGVVAPNALKVVDKFVFRRKHGRRYAAQEKHRKLAETFYYLKRSGLIQMEQENSGWRLWLTTKGKKRLVKMNFHTLFIKKPKQWDGKWWLVAADIPTKNHKLAADALRRKLKQMGFYSLQRTLWMYPYNPCSELEFIIKNFDIENFVTAMEVSKLDKEDEQAAKAYFKKLGTL